MDTVVDLKDKIKVSSLSELDNKEKESRINILAEEDFDDFLLANKDTVAAFLQKGTYATQGKLRIKNEFKTYLSNHKLDAYIKQLQNKEIQDVIDQTTFELDELSHDITTALLKDLKQDIQTP
jgi:hypothetical protein